MLNILIPMGGKDTFSVSEQNAYPKILSDVEGKLLIERAAMPFIKIKTDKKITVTIPEKQINDYKLNKVLPLLDASLEVFSLSGDTQGAACSCLLAIDKLELDSPLIISSFEQVLDVDVEHYLNVFLSEDVDAGVLTFDAIHPKWSYVKTDMNNYVTQAAEKLPISKNAIAGFYFYKTARLFIEAIQNMIRNDVKHNNLFYISPSLNEVILREGKVLALSIPKNKYFHIQDEHALTAFEEKVTEEKKKLHNLILQSTEEYVTQFDNKSITGIAEFFSPEFHLTDPSASIKGKQEVISYITELFSEHAELNFIAKNIIVDNKTSLIEFTLKLGDILLVGTDVIYWNEQAKMIAMNAYLYEVK